MKRLNYVLLVPALAFCFSGTLAMIGCERELEHTSKTETSGNKVKSEEHVVTQDPNGNITTENKKTEENTKTGEVKQKVETEQK